jgi:hypothetical protein
MGKGIPMQSYNTKLSTQVGLSSHEPLGDLASNLRLIVDTRQVGSRLSFELYVWYET